MADIFFSYSHKDEELRNELEKHLSILKRQGVIGTWHDRRIGAGEEFAGEISKALDCADIVLLLVSSDFLASDYCYDVEMSRAMERHKSGEAKIIPVILRPCMWHDAPFGKLLATPTDGKPVTSFPNLDEAFVDVAQSIKEAVNVVSPHSSFSTQLSEIVTTVTAVDNETPRSSNLRIKKDFSDHEKDVFADESFEFICNFFAGSLNELKNRNPEIKISFKRIDANSFMAKVYISGSQKCLCSIWNDGTLAYGGSIKYSGNDIFQNNLDKGSFNEAIYIDTDGYSLFLRPMGMQSFGMEKDKLLTKQGAAEFLWELFISPLQN